MTNVTGIRDCRQAQTLSVPVNVWITTVWRDVVETYRSLIDLSFNILSIPMISYATLVEAIAGLKARGYTIDFNLHIDGIRASHHQHSLPPEEFKITELHRFEGATDPDDEAVVYAIESTHGERGLIVNGYGVSSNPEADELLKKLRFEH